MHHCLHTRVELLDQPGRQTLAECAQCPRCAQWWREVQAGLAAVDATMAAQQPPEEYWALYQSRLRGKLAARAADQACAPLLPAVGPLFAATPTDPAADQACAPQLPAVGPLFAATPTDPAADQAFPPLLPTVGPSFAATPTDPAAEACAPQLPASPHGKISLASAPAPVPLHAGWWRGDAAARPRSAHRPTSAGQAELHGRFHAPSAGRRALGGAALLAVAASLTLLYLPRPHPPHQAGLSPAQPARVAAAAIPASSRPRRNAAPRHRARLPMPALLADTREWDYNRHLSTVRLLLTSYKNGAATGGAPHQRALARRLLERNRILRRGAESAGDTPQQSMLERAEPFLLDLAHGAAPAELRTRLKGSNIFRFLVESHAEPDVEFAPLRGGLD